MAPWTILKRSVKKFLEDRCPELAASIAFFGALSLAPVLLVMLWVFDHLPAASRQDVIDQVTATVGAQAGQVVQAISTSGEGPGTRSLAGWVSLVVLLVSSSGAFLQLQAAMNRVWDVEIQRGRGVKGYLRKRALSFLIVLSLGVLLLASLVVSAGIALLSRNADLPLGAGGWLWQGLDLVVSTALIALAFAIIFKYLPDTRCEWPDVWWGAAVTAILFSAGKIAMGLYLGKATVTSRYGAAGSAIALLLWLWVGAIIVLFGAELTQSRAAQHHRPIEPAEYAVHE